MYGVSHRRIQKAILAGELVRIYWGKLLITKQEILLEFLYHFSILSTFALLSFSKSKVCFLNVTEWISLKKSHVLFPEGSNFFFDFVGAKEVWSDLFIRKPQELWWPLGQMAVKVRVLLGHQTLSSFSRLARPICGLVPMSTYLFPLKKRQNNN